MKMPRKPPNFRDLQKLASPERFLLIQEEGIKTENEGKYRHWDILRHLHAPENLTSEEWWLGIKLRRYTGKKVIPLADSQKAPFWYTLPDKINEQLHTFDIHIGGMADVPEAIANPHTRNQYLVHSLIQEAITSSQLEGAATTREVAKEMLKSGRTPKDKNEQMILNNYLTMQKIREWKNLPLDPNLIFEIHRYVTDQTLDRSDGTGRFRREDERVMVEDTKTGEILHRPPDARELPSRLKALCDFANGKTPGYFIHPVIRAIILHFWLAYDHPFVDGNGRTARALFYWLMLREKYWVFEYISISEIILRAPVQYGEAFLYTETDENDLTYFILHQTTVIQKALQRLHQYVEEKKKEVSELEILLRAVSHFNSRQEALLADALQNPTTRYTISAHRVSHRIAYDTARQDLQELQQHGLLEMRKKGKAFVFTPSPNLSALLRRTSRQH